jgi:hypothetical protein
MAGMNASPQQALATNAFPVQTALRLLVVSRHEPPVPSPGTLGRRGRQWTRRVHIGSRGPSTRTPARHDKSPSTLPAAGHKAAQANVYYANCDAVGAAPVRVGEPGYLRKLDRDGYGVGCEN